MLWPSIVASHLVLLTAAAPAADLPSTLTLTEAVRRFDAQGFDVLLAEQALEASHADTLIAAAVPNPSLSASFAKGLNTRAGQCSDPSCAAVTWSVGLSDNGAVFDAAFGKRAARRRVAEAAWAAARLTRDDALRALHFQLKAALVDAARAAMALDATQQVKVSLDRIVELNRVRYQSGAISEADLAKVETESLSAQADVDAARLALAQARVAVAFLLGVRGPLPDFEVDPELLTARGAPAVEALAVDALLAMALERRPDLRAAGEQVTRAEASLALTQKLLWPDVQLAPQVTVLGDGQLSASPPLVGLGAQVLLPVFDRHPGELARARADQQVQRLTQQKVRAQVVAEVQGAFAAFTSAQRRLARMNGALLERARRTRDLVQLQYQKGAASLLELLDAERQLVSVNLSHVQDLADYWTSVFQLEQAVGGGLNP